MFSRPDPATDPALLAERSYLRDPKGLWYIYFVDRVLQLARVPEAVSWDQLIQRIETLYHKRLVFEAISTSDWSTQTGAWIDFRDKRKHGIIQFRAEDKEFYRRHTVFHEFGHLLMKRVLPQTDLDLLEDLTTYYNDGAVPGVSLMITSEDRECRSFARGQGAGPEEVVAERLAFRLARMVISGSQSPEIRVFG